MDLGKRLDNFGRKELQHRIGGDDIDRRDVGPADILISFVIARLALQIPSVLINLSLIPFLPVAFKREIIVFIWTSAVPSSASFA